MVENEQKQKPKAIIAGGSIAGLSTAKALILAGWDVVVLEKQPAPPTGNPTGAGLVLDPLSQKIIQSWLHQPELLHTVTLPVGIDQKQGTDKQKKVSWILARDENSNLRSAYWADLHGLLYSNLTPEMFLWGHLYLSSCISEDKTSVKVKAKVLLTGETVEIIGDLVVAADGLRSSIRQSFLPDIKLRYAGYCAWRGVIDFSGKENSETVKGIRKAYPDLGKCLYMDLNSEGHTTLVELMYERFNWVWYENQPEPQLKDNTATIKVSSEMISAMHQKVKKGWVPEMARLVEETKDPFINVIYDCDPLTQIFWDKVVLVGDAAHPTTPHYARSTNMAILDAAVLGKCLDKYRGTENLNSALEEYQSIRLPITSKQVLSSRRLGRIKQGLSLPDREPFDPKKESHEDCQVLLQKSVPHFAEPPSILESMFGST
ncbi:hypothetical protein Dsin_017267 [Dipteronia sinensis]|uniref:FAD-binding domain-containing protein n=1 Tax=Dipteronia sinensis TaxID=43782 RepID=A0AAE0AEM1_9ROSI|nr:hypothetical protein Dsin_017267 [Dipteronia sinensis]